MNYLNLTRDQAVALVDIETIEKLEKEIYKPECRTFSDVLYKRAQKEGGVYYYLIEIEYKVSIKNKNTKIVAFYRIRNDTKNLNNFDLGEAHHYAIH